MFAPLTAKKDLQARKLVASGAMLLDVRTPEEFAAGHIEGATNIPVQELGARLAEVPKHQPVVVYCASGGRSARAAAMLRQAGVGQVHDLGAMHHW
jgi:rhodanese-related sulfurtransferase